MERLHYLPGVSHGAVTVPGLEPTPVCSQTCIPSSSQGPFPLCREIQFTLPPPHPPGHREAGPGRPQLSCSRDATCLPGTRVPGLSMYVLAPGTAGEGGPWPRGSGPSLFPGLASPCWMGHAWLERGRGTHHGEGLMSSPSPTSPSPDSQWFWLRSGQVGCAPGRSEKPLSAEARGKHPQGGRR